LKLDATEKRMDRRLVFDRLWLLVVVALVLLGCSPSETESNSIGNQPPIIHDVLVSPKEVQVGGQASLTVIVFDPEGDSLAYYWSAQKGTVPSGAQGDTVVYKAPDTSGLDTVEVQVTDGPNYVKKEIRISVLAGEGPSSSPNHPPFISGITVSPETVYAGGEAKLIAFAEDPDGDPLTYYWAARRGWVPSGAQGREVSYRAPETGGEETITVIVTDGEAKVEQELKVAILSFASPAPPTFTPYPTFTPRILAMPTASPTASPTPTPTPTPTLTPMPIPTSSNLATAIQSASIFEAPDANSRELAVVRTGEQVTVLGRSAAGQWFYVRNATGVEGFVYAPRFEWSGDFDVLPVKRTEGPVVTPTPPPPVPPTVPPSTVPPSPLEIDLWVLPGLARCDRINWYQTVYIAGRGGNGVYTYYWNGEKLAGPTGESYTFELYRATSNAIIGTGKVVSGDGQVVEKELYVPVPDCFK